MQDKYLKCHSGGDFRMTPSWEEGPEQQDLDSLD